MSNSESAALLAESADEVAQNSNPRSRKRSPVWKYFEELQNEGKVICIHCRSKLAYHKGGSASMISSLSGKRKLGLEFALFRQKGRPHRSKRSEVDTYLDDSLVPLRDGEEFDVLRWWKRNQDQYPVLTKMARDFLAIPLSTVASESTFSIAGMVIDKYRNSLSSETVEALICAKDWLKEYLSEDGDDNDLEY